jgi:DNA end-binding protein Ku
VRPIWKGALTFGLVTIPVGLYPATARGEVSFRLLHVKVPWAEIVKGYEYEKGQFVVMTEPARRRAS